jgi:branched-chain amino acid transport system substrate-binding protein
MRAKALLAAVVALALVAAAGCGGSTTRTFRIGVLADCYGPFSPYYDLVLASAEAPFLQRGAKPSGKQPLAGVDDVKVAGRRVELLRGCVAGNADVIPEARRLVEEEGAGAIVGLLDPEQGLVLASYARRRPRQVFVIQPSDAPELTLDRPSPNVFRFAPDSSQTVAGLGTYAYSRLGWRTAVTVGDDDPYGWGRVAGFVAEFCALGGRVLHRAWLAPFSDSSAAATGAASSADGVFYGASQSSPAAFLRRLASLRRDVARRVVAGDDIFTWRFPARLADGLVVGGSLPPRQTRAMGALVDALTTVLPRSRAKEALQGTYVSYRDGVEAVLEGLEQARGDSGRLTAALRSLVLASPMGAIHLDANHQAVLPAYLSRVVVKRGKAVLRPLSVVPNVPQTFGGYFGAGSPPLTATRPRCLKQTATS